MTAFLVPGHLRRPARPASRLPQPICAGRTSARASLRLRAAVAAEAPGAALICPTFEAVLGQARWSWPRRAGTPCSWVHPAPEVHARPQAPSLLPGWRRRRPSRLPWSSHQRPRRAGLIRERSFRLHPLARGGAWAEVRRRAGEAAGPWGVLFLDGRRVFEVALRPCASPWRIAWSAWRAPDTVSIRRDLLCGGRQSRPGGWRGHPRKACVFRGGGYLAPVGPLIDRIDLQIDSGRGLSDCVPAATANHRRSCAGASLARERSARAGGGHGRERLSRRRLPGARARPGRSRPGRAETAFRRALDRVLRWRARSRIWRKLRSAPACDGGGLQRGLDRLRSGLEVTA